MRLLAEVFYTSALFFAQRTLGRLGQTIDREKISALHAAGLGATEQNKLKSEDQPSKSYLKSSKNKILWKFMAFNHSYLSNRYKKTFILVICLSTLLFLSKAFAWTPLDTLKIKEVGKIAISSTEKQIAYEVLNPSVSEDKGIWLTEVYTYQIDKPETKNILLDVYVPNSMKWFPSRDSLLFLAKADGKTRICRLFVDTNLTETLLEENFNITAFSVSHSDKIAFLVLSKPILNKFFEVVDEFLPQSKLHLLNIPTQTVELLTGIN